LTAHRVISQRFLNVVDGVMVDTRHETQVHATHQNHEL
jgi:hypothetical protein